MLQTNPLLKTSINNLWNTLWSGGIANPLTAIEQITYLLFIRRLDDIESDLEDAARRSEEQYESTRFGGTYIPYVDEALYLFKDKDDYPKYVDDLEAARKKIADLKSPRSKQELRWSVFKKIESPIELLDHVRHNVFPFIKSLNGNASPFTKHMANAAFVIEKPSLLSDAIKRIDEIYIEIAKDSEIGGHAFQDIQGDVYEMLLSEIGQSGKNGQFRTPRHIIKFITELVQPRLGDKIADPACGTAGFLLASYQHILTNLVKKEGSLNVETDDDGFNVSTNSSFIKAEEKRILDQSFYGFDIDVTMVRLALMNLMMHGIDNPKIEFMDSLSKSYNEAGKYDVVLANPPFTGKIDRNDVNPNIRVQGGASELLFLERISSMLRPGGKGGVIIPEGVLFGSSNNHKQTREILLKDNRLEAVISLPSGCFKPYTGVKTAILIFTKVEENSANWNTNSVWFYELLSDGYSLDDNRRRLKDYPLQEAISTFFDRQTTTAADRKRYFYVPIEEIIHNDLDLSYNRYRELQYEKQFYEAPKDILLKLIQLEEEIQRDLVSLNGMIG